MINILIFSNCHASFYKDYLMHVVDKNVCNVEHILSYENLDHFNNVKDKFSNADILIVQPIQSYKELKIDNIKKILKPNCRVIVVPFVRFNGFWPSNDVRVLEYIQKAAVIFFPKIYNQHQIKPYLDGVDYDRNFVLSTFNDAMIKFVELEKLGDIRFVDFFKHNYKHIPLFRDPYHPTLPFLRYIALQIIELVEEYLLMEYGLKLSTESLKSSFNLNYEKEYGHFKPITNRFADVLELRYDLNSYFIYSRHDFLAGVIKLENDGDKNISDLNELKKYFDNEYIV